MVEYLQKKLNQFDFYHTMFSNQECVTNMRCKHSCVLLVISKQLHREPWDDEDNEAGYRINWKNGVLLLEIPVIESLKIKQLNMICLMK